MYNILNHPMMHQRRCTKGDAPDVMHQRSCTRGHAPDVMHQTWCTRRDAPEVMHQTWRRRICIVLLCLVVIVLWSAPTFPAASTPSLCSHRWPGSECWEGPKCWPTWLVQDFTKNFNTWLCSENSCTHFSAGCVSHLLHMGCICAIQGGRTCRISKDWNAAFSNFFVVTKTPFL